MKTSKRPSNRDRNMHDNFAARTLAELPQAFIKIQFLRSQIEVGLRFPRIMPCEVYSLLS